MSEECKVEQKESLCKNWFIYNGTTYLQRKVETERKTFHLLSYSPNGWTRSRVAGIQTRVHTRCQRSEVVVESVGSL